MAMLLPLPEWPSTAVVLSISALLAHQILRKFEMFSLPFHAFLLLAPPAIASNRASSAGIGWPSASQLVFCYATYLAVLTLSVVSPFHPLHRYPGPVWCRTSMFWHAIRTTDGKQMTYLRSLHDTYGDIVRIGPNHLSIRDASLVRQVLGVSGIQKGATYKGATLSETNVPFIGIQNAEEHAQRRRAWNRGLAPAALRDYDHTTSNRVHQLVDVLERQEGAVVLGKWINYFAYDFMSDMVFGGGSEQMQEGDKGDIWAMVDKGAEIAFHLGQLPWLGIYLGHIPGAGGPLNMLLEHGRKETTKRVAKGSSTRDLFYYLNNEDLPREDPPPERHLLDDGVLAMVAGSDTSSSAITSIFHCLLSHPEAYAALQEEVDHFYPQGEDVCSTANHRDMHYLTAVIHETLRLFPPAPTSSSRQVPHNAAPVVLGSVVLPPGTHVYIPPYVLHRDARNFVFPDEFWPERWLVASGQLPLERARAPAPHTVAPPSSSRSRSRSADGHASCQWELDSGFVHNEEGFIPFSHGPMNCVGKGLAMQQMRSVVCALVQRFRVRLEEGWDPRRYEEGFKDYLVANRPELPVVLERRY
ncbi:high nitrogen upregulated cytochrome P450 monooxygenase 2 [Ganoderma leucocontextum]|nr:high nitrogen upregulated cytochrome P450 monooxygenase 2 [Ganoderma leucocontextum]